MLCTKAGDASVDNHGMNGARPGRLWVTSGWVFSERQREQLPQVSGLLVQEQRLTCAVYGYPRLTGMALWISWGVPAPPLVPCSLPLTD